MNNVIFGYAMSIRIRVSVFKLFLVCSFVWVFKFITVAINISSSEGQFCSVQFSHSVLSDSETKSQHARPPCPWPSPGVHSDSCPLSRWCHPAISSSVVPFSSCPQSFPASGCFQRSQLFASGGQSTRVLASTSVLPTTEWASIKMTMVLLICHSNPCL